MKNRALAFLSSAAIVLLAGCVADPFGYEQASVVRNAPVRKHAATGAVAYRSSRDAGNGIGGGAAEAAAVAGAAWREQQRRE